MRVILDTHIMIWAIQGSPRLSQSVRDIINDDNNDVYFSTVSLIEISIKRKAHPEDMPFDAREARKLFVENGYEELPIDSLHAEAMDDLPLLHRDPFDRMLLAQAKAEGMKVVSHDNRFPAYGDFVIAV